MLGLDWEGMFGLSVPVMEIVVRGSAVYWFLFVLFRFAVRREMGSVGVADLLVLVIIADAAQNAMAGEYKSITDGFILIATIVFWNLLLDWASYRFPKIGRFAEPRPLHLINNGRILHRNLAQEMLTEEELMSKLREEGLQDVSQVKDAYMESDGRISVIKRKS
jgi:uncharacterized membrane protein YcaP (DUF421 family)